MSNKTLVFEENEIKDFYFFGNQIIEFIVFTKELKIGFKAFNYCPNLKTVIFLNKTIIDELAFTNCVRLEKVIFTDENNFESSICKSFDNTPFKRKINSQTKYNDYILNSI